MKKTEAKKTEANNQTETKWLSLRHLKLKERLGASSLEDFIFSELKSKGLKILKLYMSHDGVNVIEEYREGFPPKMVTTVHPLLSPLSSSSELCYIHLVWEQTYDPVFEDVLEVTHFLSTLSNHIPQPEDERF